MKIRKFNEGLKKSLYGIKPQSPIQRRESTYPIKCKFKDREPDPGICYVIDIDFEYQIITCSNGMHRFGNIDFDQVEFIPDIFVFNKYNL